ncbi:hypothetical protein GLP30_05015 [Photobacterium phosphoreum]|uniref:Type 4 fimbrial biogenesis protein PilX N-terminal domain-containing protein n=1 Tax=Photobacterium phosphoreum TaxID=659 RepID=A0AAW4ZS46_PHOPO|nr:hypothetical protein [Photobacterium phosphoreum]MCD9490188.1 hypothetical protein [Photobacterium phosphoreum]MCF2189454.1 hypothetical protein [Photobacterium phosphoreum]MCF2301208.1 hypothetical protein [Photobacterium phosphoreum]
MNKHQQSGMTTLLITSMLLIVALLFSLASYKNLFYQIKRTQNEVLARQAHWAAEGGLECGFAEYKIKKNNFTDFDECNTAELELTLTPVTSTEFQLESEIIKSLALKKITKTIELGGGGVVSTLETSASVELKGSQHFVPNSTEDTNNRGEYLCKSITSGGVVSFKYNNGTDDHFLTTDSSVSDHAGGPLGPVSFGCASDYRSNLFDVNHPPTGETISVKGKDIVENATLDIFKSIFGKDISEYSQVMTEIESDPKGIIIGEGVLDRTSSGWVEKCNELVKKSYEEGKRRIWIHGSCALTGNLFGSAIENTADNSVQLIFFDGLVLMEAVSHINGLIYQYVSKDFNSKNGWLGLFDDQTDIGVIPGGFQRHNVVAGEYDKSVINVHGSVYIDGGIGIDAPNKIVNIDGSIIPSYNKGKSSKYIDSLSWQQGSWHDF